MIDRHGVRVAALATLVFAGCDGLAERPGHDFSVQVLDEEPIEVIGLIYAPVRFVVNGCDAFDLALDDDGTRRPLSYAVQPDGTFLASVPVAWLQDLSSCGSFLSPIYHHKPGTLVTTCHDAQRSARAAFSLRDRDSYEHFVTYHGELRALFPSDWPGYPTWIATSVYGGEVYSRSGGLLSGEWAPALNPAAYRNALVRPRLVRSGDRAFATLGCETYPQCPRISIGPGESVAGERLAEIDLTRYSQPPRGIAHVSTNVIDMAFADDGALIVVSDTSLGRNPEGGTQAENAAARWGETIVWRVVPAPEGSQGVVEDAATVIARFPRETVVTRLSRTASGALAFLTLADPPSTPVLLNLRITDGSTVSTSYSYTTNDAWCFNVDGPIGFDYSGASLSPDGSSLILPMCNGLAHGYNYGWVNTDPSDRVPHWFGRPPFPFRPSESRWHENIFSPYVHGGSAWLPDAVALWSGGDIMSGVVNGGSVVHVFEATPPHDFRYEYVVRALPGASIEPALLGVIAVGDHLVLTTTSGVRILDATGKLVGGTDPLPCGATTTATAEQIGPTTVAVGVGDTVLTFEVGP